MGKALLVVLLAVGCTLSGHVAAQQKWSVKPGAVTKVDKRLYRDREARVTGTFVFEADSNGIESNRYGGACLVADLTAQGIGKKVCSSDLDCHPVVKVERRPGQPEVPGVTVPAYEGYCLASGPRDRVRSCWVRPGPQPEFCMTSKQTGGPLQAKQYALPVVKADPTGKGPVRWRIHSCLNPNVPPPPGEQPCAVRGTTNKQTNDGPILP
jgi:hypothetical protein